MFFIMDLIFSVFFFISGFKS
uniref:Uncharacterized protein n=1 Tax=Anguilla anguilla TaxID=7936 RepID=A0A0E9UIZ2_ANGAN